jgi:hypothetical protein
MVRFIGTLALTCRRPHKALSRVFTIGRRTYQV